MHIPNWYFPHSVTQIAEIPEHVPFYDSGTNFHQIKSNDLDFLSTTTDLLHISNTQVNDIKMKTYYLHCTDFRIDNLPLTISGVEAEVSIQRAGRITDDTIQLLSNSTLIGENQANYSLDINKLFGSPTSLWGTQNIVIDSSFGVALRFQSHPLTPHRASPKINYIRIRVW